MVIKKLFKVFLSIILYILVLMACDNSRKRIYISGYGDGDNYDNNIVNTDVFYKTLKS